jgi:hypothetical protein
MPASIAYMVYREHVAESDYLTYIEESGGHQPRPLAAIPPSTIGVQMAAVEDTLEKLSRVW